MNSNKNYKGLYIILLGPSGVGKSTIGNALIRLLYCRRHKIFSRLILIKYYHGLAHILWSFVCKLIVGKPSKYAPWAIIYASGKDKLLRSMIKISIFIDVIFNFPIRIILIKLLKYLGFIIISEEHLLESLLEYIYILKTSSIRKSFPILFCLKLLYAEAYKIVPDIVVMLDANLINLIIRWKARLRSDPYINYIKFQRAVLNKLKALISIIRPVSLICYFDTSNMTEKEVLLYVLECLHNALMPD